MHLAHLPAILYVSDEDLSADRLAADLLSVSLHRQANPVMNAAVGAILFVQGIAVQGQASELVSDGDVQGARVVEISERHAARVPELENLRQQAGVRTPDFIYLNPTSATGGANWDFSVKK